MTYPDRLNLPDEVRARLNDAGLAVAEPLEGVSAVLRNQLEEVRWAPALELRAEGDDVGVEGYAATWGVPYDVAGGPPIGWTEIVERKGVKRALKEGDVRLLVNHEGLPLARSRSKTLTLVDDEVGLRAYAPALDLRNPVVQEVRSVLERGDADQMSWAFRVARQEWNEDYTERTIREVSRVYDVSIVTFPANEATIVGLRSDEEPDEEIAAELAVRGMSLDLARAIADQYRRRCVA